MMIKHWMYNLMASAHRDAAMRQMRELERKLPSQATRFAVPFVFRGKGHFKKLEPRQNPVEIEALYKKVCDLRPRRVLEIGTARGGSLYLWMQAAADDAVVVSVDLPGGDFGGAYPEARTPFYQALARQGQKLHLLRADSHDPATRQRVRDLFNGEPIDFAFIDGDHTYEGVKADFQQYGPLVRPGGLIGFHDILHRPQSPSIRVDQLWAELRNQYAVEELIGPEGSGKKIGIGVVNVPEQGLGLSDNR